MKRAVVLLSGGIDSTITLAVAGNEGYDLYAMTFDYGQRHGVELALAKRSAARFNVQRHIIMKIDLGAIGGSALTSDIEVPKDVKSSIVNRQSLIPVTYVPARNTIFLSFALAFAESIGSEDIFIGANAIDYSGYPDCRPEFIKAFEKMANLATKASVEGSAEFNIHAPLINLSKGEIIKKGRELGVDLSLTWSCYDPQKRQKDDGRKTKDEKESSSLVPHPSSFGYVPCGHCDSCVLRARGFKEAGAEDPLKLKAEN